MTQKFRKFSTSYTSLLSCWICYVGRVFDRVWRWSGTNTILMTFNRILHTGNLFDVFSLVEIQFAMHVIKQKASENSARLQLDLIDQFILLVILDQLCRQSFLLNKILEIKNFSFPLFLPTNTFTFGADQPLPLALVSIIFITTQEYSRLSIDSIPSYAGNLWVAFNSCKTLLI